MYNNDKRVVLTLDAGGTNFVFSAMQGIRDVTEPFTLPTYGNDLDKCLDALVYGFKTIGERIALLGHGPPVAISFAFPGPADYKSGVIGDLPNFPCFRGGIALGPFLNEQFRLPVFINNDGNLFAYGEALAGALPYINRQFEKRGSPRRYANLLGITFGTGFGAGVVIGHNLLTGDNGCGGDIWAVKNKFEAKFIAEDSVSIRGIMRTYHQITHGTNPEYSPKDLYDVAEGRKAGDQKAAKHSFLRFGEAAGDAIASFQAFTDGVIVLGGGIVNAAKYFLPALKGELKAQCYSSSGQAFNRLPMAMLDLAEESERELFYADNAAVVTVPHSRTMVRYEREKKSALLVSELGTSRAIALGAYTFALTKLDQ